MSTGTAVATTENAKPKSVITSMADRFGMSPQAFEATVRATCMPQGRDVQPMTREEFAAGIMVAEKYTLNPILREIYFYPRRGGGIVPVVSIDGWLSLINRRKELDGVEFDELHDDKGKLVSITCRIYRTDRKHPTIVTEHLSECIRDTAPWKMPHRMLRHKALIQCARYAFGFAGIHDEDEAERIVEATAQIVGPAAPPPPPAEPARPAIAPQPPANANAGPAAPPAEAVEEAEIVETPSPAEWGGNEEDRAAIQRSFDRGMAEFGGVPAAVQAMGIGVGQPDQPQHPPLAQEEPFDVEMWLDEARERFQEAKTAADVDDVHAMFEDTASNELGMAERQKYQDMHEAALARVAKQGQAAAPVIRYFIHPESSSYVTTEDGSGDQRDPLVEEVDQEQYERFKAEVDADDDSIIADFPGNDAIKATEKTPGEKYLERIRTALADPIRTFDSLAGLWNATKGERQDLITNGEITREQSKELQAAIKARGEQAQAAAPASTGPAAPPAEESEITRYDREFRARVDACQTLEEISTLSAGTLAERGKFAGSPLQKEWQKLVADRRKQIAGIA